MAQLKDKLMNRTIEGKLSLDSGDQVSQVVNPLIASAIEADKDILSQIIYGSYQSDSIVTFPKNAYPLMIEEDEAYGEMLYFDYENGCLLGADGSSYESSMHVNVASDGTVSIVFDGVDSVHINRLLYVGNCHMFEGAPFNTYKILNPSKLYKHALRMSDNTQFYVITTSSENAPQQVFSEYLDNLFMSDSIISIRNSITQFFYNYDESILYGMNSNSITAISIDTMTISSDTVTPL